jgi:hypothetical protein
MKIIDQLSKIIAPVKNLSEGVYHLQSLTNNNVPFRIHLRVDKGGSGILILNASTVLHLNPTATEYAYHIIQGSDSESASREISSRYRIGKSQARQDYDEFVQRIMSIIQDNDLDPVNNLGFDYSQPNSFELNAPLRMDFALTYRLPPESDPINAPIKRVERELTTTEWVSAMDRAWAMGVPHIVFTGGEPTLREDLSILIAHAEKNGQVAGLITDGNKLSDKIYLDNILQTGLDHLMIILPVSTEPNWVAIKNVLDADLFFSVHLTITPENAEKCEDAINKLGQFGIENISLSYSDPKLRGLVDNAYKCAIEINMRIISNLPVPYSEANPVAFELEEDFEPSGAGKTWLYVEPDGDVLPSQGQASHILGNILTDTWKEIYKH